MRVQGKQSHDDERHHGDDESCGNPHQTFGTHHCAEELFASFQTETCQIERQSELAQHERCGARGVADEVGAWPECSYEYAHYDASACDAEMYRCAHSRQMDGNHAYGKSQNHTEEYGSEVRLVEHLDGVAEEFLGVFDVARCADNGEMVAVLQAQVIARKQFDVAAHYAADVHSVGCAHVQGTECLAVEAGACEQYYATLHVAVYCVPVNMIFVAVPVFLHFLTEQDVHGFRLVYFCHHEHAVVQLHLCVSQRHYHLTVAPDARDDEMTVGHLRYFGDGLVL